VGFSDSVRKCLKDYATFDGRATRSEFWWFYLFVVLVAIVGYIPFLILLLIGSAASGDDGSAIGTLFIVLSVIWIIVVVIAEIALIVPQLAVGCRRLHDRGQSGWLQLLLFVPCGNIALLVLWAMEGTPGDNAHGLKPA
jgi:uncharacterized membrane protein YhaH (DUF805 family)